MRARAGDDLSRPARVLTWHIPPHWTDDMVQNRGGFGLGVLICTVLLVRLCRMSSFVVRFQNQTIVIVYVEKHTFLYLKIPNTKIKLIL